MASPLSLLPHQVEALDWMIKRERSHPSGGILADEPGMGKTIMTIALLTHNPVPHTLVIAPKSVSPQWILEMRRFSDLTIDLFDRKSERPHVLPMVCVAPYSVLVTMKSRKRKTPAAIKADERRHWISDIPWDRVIIDEAHVMKNPKSQVAKGALRLEARHKFALTGTPIQNCRMDLIMLANWIGYSGGNDVRKICADLVLRRTQEDVPDAFSLPKLHMSVRTVELSPEERLMYDSVFKYARERVANGLSHNNQMEVLEAILRCRQMCSHPQVFIAGMRKKYQVDLEMSSFDTDLIVDDWTEDCAKSMALCDLIEGQGQGEKAIVFCSFVQEMQVYRRLLAERGIEGGMFHGGLNSDARAELLDRFRNDPALPVLLAQISAGGVGLNLQQANHVYILSPQWNPMWEVQALGRAYRHGQTREVRFVRLVARDTIEERICEIQERKLSLISTALDDPRIVQKLSNANLGLTIKDVKYMFRK